MDSCPECQSPLCDYHHGDLTERICWNCGHYESDSQAYTDCPAMFKDIVRKNPTRFLHRFLKVIPADEFLQRKRADDNLKEPERMAKVFDVNRVVSEYRVQMRCA